VGWWVAGQGLNTGCTETERNRVCRSPVSGIGAPGFLRS
jgi:hypothetical protein